MATFVFFNSSKSIFIEVKVNMAKDTDEIFTIMDIQGVNDTAISIGFDIERLPSSKGAMKDLAEELNLGCHFLIDNPDIEDELLNSSEGTLKLINTGSLGRFIRKTEVYNPLEHTGGTAPFTYAITSGSLPAGLSLDTDEGIISGTVTASTGTYHFDVTITDLDLDTDTGSYTIYVTNN